MYKTVLFLLIVFVASCTKDISIELDGHDSKLVLNSFFSPGDSLCVHISKSIPSLDSDTLFYVNNAEIELLNNGVMLGIMQHMGKGFYKLPVQLESEMEYSINVNAPNLNSISSKNSIPSQVPMLSFDTVSINSKYLYCEIEFQDPLATRNYYLLDVRSKHPIRSVDSIFTNQISLVVSDFIVENGDSGEKRNRIYFSDELIQGSTYYLSFILDKEQLLNSLIDTSNILYVSFKTISYDYYGYVKTYYESQNQQMDVYTNIDNGYGIFAGYNLSQDSLMFSW